MKIAVTGASGFVGRKILETYPEAQAAPSVRGMTDDDIAKLFAELDAELLIHTAAMSDIQDCKEHPEKSYRANVILPELIAKNFKGEKLIMFSSDQVYSGSKEKGPFTEDMTCPGNLYAEEKLEMEKRVLAIRPDTVLLRAEWMYDYISYKGNYFLNLLNAKDTVAYSSQEYRGVTYLKEVADQMVACASMPGGVYNFGSETGKSIYDVTVDFVRYLGLDINVVDTKPNCNLWMDCSKARRYGVDFSDIYDGLVKCAEDYKKIR